MNVIIEGKVTLGNHVRIGAGSVLKDSTIVQDLIRFLDNVLQWFITTAPDTLKRLNIVQSESALLDLGHSGGIHTYSPKMIPLEVVDSIPRYSMQILFIN